MNLYQLPLLLLVLILNILNGQAQDCSNIIPSIYGYPQNDEEGHVIISTQQNEIYVAGTKDDSTILFKVKLTGEIEWSLTMDIIPGNEYPNGIIVDSDGMLAILGTLGNNGSADGIYLFRFDPVNQSLLWAKQYSHSSDDFAFSIIQKGNGNYVISVQPTFTGPNHEDAVLLEVNKSDGTLDLDFSVSYRLGGTETLFEIAYYENFIYGVGRFKDGGSVADFRHTLVKIDPGDGHQVWAKFGHVSDAENARLYGSDLIIDEGSIISLYSGDPDGTSTTNTSMFLQKTSLDGDLIWVMEYDIPGSIDLALDIVRISDGYIILAHRRAEGEYVLFKTNLNGKALWSRSYRFGSLSNPFGILQGSSLLTNTDEHIFFTGFGRDVNNNQDLFIARMDLEGNATSSCIETIEFDIFEHEILNPVFYESFPQEENVTFNEEGVNAPAFQTQLEASCDSDLSILTTIRKNICQNESFEGYTITGVYMDTFELANGCDSIRILELTSFGCVPVIYYNLNACEAYMHNGTNMDYSEFTPSYPEFACADVEAGNLYRINPLDNKHSCTPGVNNTDAMCVSSSPSCTYTAGHEASVIIEFSVDPLEDSLFTFSKLEFYEKAPSTYVWLNGPSGPNNYPQRYGLRILKNGSEIFRNESISTNLNWTLQSFNFIDSQIFKVEGITDFRIELLPYCPVGNGATVSAWDIDEIRIYGACAPIDFNVIVGRIETKDGRPISDSQIWMAKNPWFMDYTESTSINNGEYEFDNILAEKVFLQVNKKDDILNGVTTIDIIYLQKHLLGISDLNTLADYIAADINNNGSVSALDILELRKIILGINTSFAQNQIWKFGPADQNWQSSDISAFMDRESVNLLGDTSIANFVGIKTGDLNGDVFLFTGDDPTQPRNNEELVMKMDEIEIGKDEVVDVRIKAGTNVHMIGMQLAFDLKDIEIVGINSGELNITSANFHVDGDVLKISWNESETVNVNENVLLFTLVVKAQTTTSSTKSISLNANALTAEYYSQDLIAGVIVFKADQRQNIPSDIHSLIVEPNPVQHEATVRFNLLQEGVVTLNFYDVSGSSVYAIEQFYPAGQNEVRVTKKQLKSQQGMIFCQMKSGSSFSVEKFMMTE